MKTNCPTIVGTAVNVSVQFKATISGALADPSAVSFKIRKPDKTTVTYVYGVGVELVKDAVGEYHVIVLLNQKGRWDFEYVGTGGVAVVNTSSIIVDGGI